MTRSERRPQLEALLRQFLSTMAEPAELRRLIEANPEILGDDFDTLMVQFVASLRHQGEAEQAQLVEQYRWLLAECRRLGVSGAFVKANAYSVMGGFLRAEGPDEKLAYLRAPGAGRPDQSGRALPDARGGPGGRRRGSGPVPPQPPDAARRRRHDVARGGAPG